MKTEKIEQLMLLEQSGELNFVRRWQLARALAARPELKRFREDLLALTAASRSSSPVGEPGASVLGEIRKAAAEQSQHNVPIDALYGSWLRPVIAMAAAAAAIGGIAVVNQLQGASRVSMVAQHGQRWEDSIDAELSKVSTMLATSFDISTDASTSDANSIARELLALEGVRQ